jgi:hypothetical protein
VIGSLPSPGCRPANGRALARKGTGLFYDQDWYEDWAFAKECGEAAWQLIRKTPVAGSLSETRDEQTKRLSKNEEVPSVRVVV